MIIYILNGPAEGEFITLSDNTDHFDLPVLMSDVNKCSIDRFNNSCTIAHKVITYVPLLAPDGKPSISDKGNHIWEIRRIG
jgi:hypothetical protein